MNKFNLAVGVNVSVNGWLSVLWFTSDTPKMHPSSYPLSNRICFSQSEVCTGKLNHIFSLMQRISSNHSFVWKETLCASVVDELGALLQTSAYSGYYDFDFCATVSVFVSPLPNVPPWKIWGSSYTGDLEVKEQENAQTALICALCRTFSWESECIRHSCKQNFKCSFGHFSSSLTVKLEGFF